MVKTYHIGVIGGDGTGPEVVREGIKVAEAAMNKYGFKVDWVYYDLGGERYKRTGEILPEGVLPELKKLDGIYLGAIGHPDVKAGILERGLLLRYALSWFNTSTCAPSSSIQCRLAV
jgi:3-isopropylmalate dehydrogenase